MKEYASAMFNLACMDLFNFNRDREQDGVIRNWLEKAAAQVIITLVLHVNCRSLAEQYHRNSFVESKQEQFAACSRVSFARALC